MKKFTLVTMTLLLILSSSYSCKHSDRGSSSVAAADQSDNVDAMLILDDMVLAEAKCRNPLLNLLTSSATDALLRNGASNGLGVDAPVGKKMKEAGAYYQMLRLASLFDSEFSDGIANPKITPCLPKSLGFHLGTFSKAYIDAAPQAMTPDNKRAKEAAMLVKSTVGPLNIVTLSVAEDVKAWPAGSKLPLEFRTALQKGVREKMIYAKTGQDRSKSALDRITAIATGFAPLYVSINAEFARENSKAYLEAYLPPLAEVENVAKDDANAWNLKPGLKRIALPKPVDIKIGRLTDIGYLQSPGDNDLPLMKLRMFKNWQDPNRIKAQIVFGKLDERGLEKGALSIDHRDYRDAFYIGLTPAISIAESDLIVVKEVKKQINDAISIYRLDARIHRLGVDLVRKEPTAKSNVTELDFKPKFSMKDSDISFRLYQRTDNELDTKILSTLKFTCARLQGTSSDCYRDFGVYTELRDFFLNGESAPQDSNLMTRIGLKFREAANRAIALNVKFVIDWNMATIEEAIDSQFATILADIVERQSKLAKAVNEELERKKLNSHH